MLGGVVLIGKKILAISRDLLFPVFCISCNAEGEWLCSACLAKLQLEIEPQFFRHPYLDKVIALADYKNEIVTRLVHLLKYEYVEEIGGIFDKLIETFIKNNSVMFGSGRFSAIIPIPLHKKRYLERGFNQAEILAESWSRYLGVPILKNALIRQRQTKTQVGLSGEERRSNLQGAFVLPKPLAGIERVILIDDVFTTGSTLEEAGRILKSVGVSEVWGTVIAREA